MGHVLASGVAELPGLRGIRGVGFCRGGGQQQQVIFHAAILVSSLAARAARGDGVQREHATVTATEDSCCLLATFDALFVSMASHPLASQRY